MLRFQQSRRGVLQLVGLVVFVVALLQLRHLGIVGYLAIDASNLLVKIPKYDRTYRDQQIEFWRSFEYALNSNAPGVPKLNRTTSMVATGFDREKGVPREDHLNIPESDIEQMTLAHHNFMTGLETNPPALPYIPGTRGVVTTAGGAYLPLVVMSLRMLRRTGSTLPAEVFLGSSSEYESYVCETTLPALNAKCVVLPEIMDAVGHEVSIAKYQLKIFAMIFSSFEDVVFLDADAFALKDPDQLFASEPYLSTGLVTWPDFWTLSESKHFFTISGQEVPPTNLRQSSETGEILVSKKKHHLSLLLATYYNYYGPDHYYPLLSQGAPGEGDKETFLAAAAVFKLRFYAVSETVQAIGHNDGHGLAGSAMVQFDPRDDLALIAQGIFRNGEPRSKHPVRPFFVHVNYPKFNPARVFDDTALVQDQEGRYRRCWIESVEVIKEFEVDVEQQYWEEAKWTACNLAGKFQDWTGHDDVCTKTTEYYHAVFE